MTSLKFIPLLIILSIVIYLGFLSFTTRQHTTRSEADRQLSPCPDKPNCVSSESERNRHKIDAFPLIDKDRDKSWDKLIDSIEHTGGEIRVNDGVYCHAVFTSFVFRFKDDLEAVMEKDRIAIRSASRAGQSDLGQNRKRIEKIRLYYQSKNRTRPNT